MFRVVLLVCGSVFLSGSLVQSTLPQNQWTPPVLFDGA